MNRRHWKKLIGFVGLAALFLALSAVWASAETEGIFTYSITNNVATITKVDCSEVKDIVIPETLGGYPVTTLNRDSCFEDNDSIRGNGPDTLFIPKTLTTIRSGAFTFSDIKAFIVDAENPNFTAVDGVLFSKDMKTLIQASGGFAAECYTVPDGVETIGSHAFHTCILIEEIVFPASLRTIGDQAFFHAMNLKSIHLNEGLTTIAENCFAWCYALESITIPSTLRTISGSAFTECNALETIILSEGSAVISYFAFESCPLLKQVYLPSTITAIGTGAFGNCTTCNIHYNVPIEAYQSLTFENDNDILTFSGSGAIPAGWHYWDAEKDTVTPEQLQLKNIHSEFEIVVISDGVIAESSMKLCHITETGVRG